MDVLIEKLKNLGYGCNIGTKYYGALAYADDLILLSPSVKGLQEMINLCESYGKEYNVTFNERKTECIKFGNNNKSNPTLYMSGSQLQWKNEVKHLGNILNSNTDDSSDINYKRGIFYGNVNKLLANFDTIPSNVLDHLYQTYCCSFYGSQLWDLSSKYMDNIFIAW